MEEREPSYYEIALTHRQVFGVFVVLLLSVVVAFFAGMWLGRREGVSMPVASAAERAAPEDEEGEALGELNFFSEASTPPPGRPANRESAPRRDRPTAEDSAAPSAVAPPIEPPASVVEAPEAAVGERSATAPPVESVIPPDGDALVVQVFSSADRPQAERIVDRLREAGFAALLSPVEVDTRTMYRVRIGPFGERADAERVAARIRREFRLDTWITR